MPADGLRPFPLGTGGNNSTSSWGICATFCRNIFSRAWAMRTMSSVGCRKKNTSPCCIIHIFEAERFESRFWNPQWHCPSNKWWYPSSNNKETGSSPSLHATPLLFYSGLACNNYSLWVCCIQRVTRTSSRSLITSILCNSVEAANWNRWVVLLCLPAGPREECKHIVCGSN